VSGLFRAELLGQGWILRAALNRQVWQWRETRGSCGSWRCTWCRCSCLRPS